MLRFVAGSTLTSPVPGAIAKTASSVPIGHRKSPSTCPIAVTRSATLGRHLAHATGAALENLEAFAVARAAAAAGVDAIGAVLGIANRVGPRGHHEWRANHDAASRAACRLVWSFVRRE